jgi:hypothetical protein
MEVKTFMKTSVFWFFLLEDHYCFFPEIYKIFSILFHRVNSTGIDDRQA